MARKRYPGDLTEGQWRLIEPSIPPPKSGGRPRTSDMREVVNAILYVNRTGCSWRPLPHEFPPWITCYYDFRRFQRDETWERLHDPLRVRVRKKAGRKPTPSAGILDSQTVKTTEKGGIGATTPGRKRWAASVM